MDTFTLIEPLEETGDFWLDIDAEALSPLSEREQYAFDAAASANSTMPDNDPRDEHDL